MGCHGDPVGQACSHAHSACGQPACEAPGDRHPVVAGPVSADDRDDRRRRQRVESAGRSEDFEHARHGTAAQGGRVVSIVTADRLWVAGSLVCRVIEALVVGSELIGPRPGNSVDQLAVGERQQLQQPAAVARAELERPAQSRQQPGAPPAAPASSLSRLAPSARAHAARLVASRESGRIAIAAPRSWALTRAPRVQVGDRACHTQHPVLAARAQQPRPARGIDDLLAARVESDVCAEHAGVHVRVDGHAVRRQPVWPGARERAATRSRAWSEPIVVARGLRAVCSLCILASRSIRSSRGPLSRRRWRAELGFAALAALAIARISARARVGGGEQHEPRRVDGRVACPSDRHAAVLEGLAQCLERRARELRELVEEQHATVGENDLPDAATARAADQTGRGDRMVRSTEWSALGQLLDT